MTEAVCGKKIAETCRRDLKEAPNSFITKSFKHKYIKPEIKTVVKVTATFESSIFGTISFLLLSFFCVRTAYNPRPSARLPIS
jgi:hypothetical protein